MNDAFDDGFGLTRKWLETGCNGERPYPKTDLIDADRIDWWRGSDKAFAFCAELNKQEEVKITMIEDIVLTLIYGIGCVFGSYLMFQFTPTSLVIGGIIFTYSLKKALRK